jgi:hypothetical protein
MLARLPVRWHGDWRVVATTRHTAFLAGPKMDPLCADFHALVALPALSMFDGRDSLDVGAGCLSHGCLTLIRAARGAQRKSRWTPRPLRTPRA